MFTKGGVFSLNDLFWNAVLYRKLLIKSQFSCVSRISSCIKINVSSKNGFLGSIGEYRVCFVLFQPIYSLRCDKRTGLL